MSGYMEVSQQTTLHSKSAPYYGQSQTAEQYWLEKISDSLGLSILKPI